LVQPSAQKGRSKGRLEEECTDFSIRERGRIQNQAEREHYVHDKAVSASGIRYHPRKTCPREGGPGFRELLSVVGIKGEKGRKLKKS